MELKQIVRRAVRRWAEKIASKRAQRQARLALPSGSDLSERKAGRLGVAGSVAGHIGEITVAESRPESFTRPTSRKAEAHDAKDNAPAHLDLQLAAFAEERYDLRHNLLTGQAEFRPKGQDAAAFLPLTARDLNSLCLAAHEAGIPCWDRDVSRFVASDRLPDYHPFRDYFDRLPPWDGEDRLDALARRVSDSALWVSGFRRWMLAVAAQWMGGGERPCQQYGPGIGERAARIGKIHILPQPPATRTVRLLHRQRGRDEHRPYGTAFGGNGTHQPRRVRPHPRPPPSGLEERDAAHRPARAQGLPARHAPSAAHRLLHRHVQQP